MSDKADDESDVWFFTFGSGQQHQGRYVRIRGRFMQARHRMFEVFGPKWCGQYATAEEAGVDRFGLTELNIGGLPLVAPSQGKEPGR
jgi:hypothetical protein